MRRKLSAGNADSFLRMPVIHLSFVNIVNIDLVFKSPLKLFKVLSIVSFCTKMDAARLARLLNEARKCNLDDPGISGVIADLVAPNPEIEAPPTVAVTDPDTHEVPSRGRGRVRERGRGRGTNQKMILLVASAMLLSSASFSKETLGVETDTAPTSKANSHAIHSKAATPHKGSKRCHTISTPVKRFKVSAASPSGLPHSSLSPAYAHTAHVKGARAVSSAAIRTSRYGKALKTMMSSIKARKAFDKMLTLQLRGEMSRATMSALSAKLTRNLLNTGYKLGLTRSDPTARAKIDSLREEAKDRAKCISRCSISTSTPNHLPSVHRIAWHAKEEDMAHIGDINAAVTEAPDEAFFCPDTDP
ncbi:hypothetical protein CAPTEDRAFT_187226 [Capitella teleta]|uniref:Uncharacterized protein n=1 Tax=Capitella teleta TaxID=283909 RepID=R7UYX5_CAPTE|nr:hypothetical protein CAPTEDRAFT_187226 [Capitella teleta]|eukprot:ELU11529.1 hypothetical protein CAPTEDRAFT_187226 [Capitella teleta]